MFFVGDLMGKALWKLVENAAAFSKARWARSVRPRRRQLPQGPSVWAKMAPREGGHASCRAGPPRPRTAVEPVNNYVHVKTADLYRPNARLTPERQGYQVLTPFGKLGYSRLPAGGVNEVCHFARDQEVVCHRESDAVQLC